MKNLFLSFFLLLITICWSCDRLLMQEKRQEIDKMNLKGLLDSLNNKVASANPLLIKRARIDEQVDSAQLHLNKDDWEKELNSFSDLKIRPGRLLTEFDEKVVNTDSTILYRYVSKNTRKEPLDSLFILTDHYENILRLKAFKNDVNYFSSSQEALVINFFSYNDKIQLPTGYQISGWQKIRTKDTIDFQIKALFVY